MVGHEHSFLKIIQRIALARLVEPSGFSVHTTVTGFGEVSFADLGKLIFCIVMAPFCK